MTYNSLLAGTAIGHSREMANYGYVANRGLDGRSGEQRMHDAGYRYAKAKEMVTAGQGAASDAFNALWASFEYRERIRSCDWRDIGVGVWTLSGSPHGTYWTIDLGVPQ
ncbi:MAG: CAP domain-containing protein [Angustibacter sp.]